MSTRRSPTLIHSCPLWSLAEHGTRGQASDKEWGALAARRLRAEF